MADLVYTLPSSGGSIWQGNYSDAAAAALGGGGYDVVVTTQGYWPPLSLTVKGLAIVLEDRPPMGVDDATRTETAARNCAQQVASYVRTGKKVFVGCHAGLNRSGLVSGLALRYLGLSGDEAVRTVKKARGEWALSNPFFEKLVRA